MEAWLIRLAINFILTRLAALGTSVNWGALTAQAEQYLDTFVPKFLQASVAGIVEGAVAAIVGVLQDSAGLAAVLVPLTQGDWPTALAALEALMAKSVHPMAPAVAAELRVLPKAA